MLDNMISKVNDSPLRIELTKVYDKFHKNIRWKFGDVRKVNFFIRLVEPNGATSFFQFGSNGYNCVYHPQS